MRHLSGRHGVQEDAVTQGKQIALGRGIGELQVTNVTPVVDILHMLSASRTKNTESGLLTIQLKYLHQVQPVRQT